MSSIESRQHHEAAVQKIDKTSPEYRDKINKAIEESYTLLQELEAATPSVEKLVNLYQLRMQQEDQPEALAASRLMSLRAETELILQRFDQQESENHRLDTYEVLLLLPEASQINRLRNYLSTGYGIDATRNPKQRTFEDIISKLANVVETTRSLIKG